MAAAGAFAALIALGDSAGQGQIEAMSRLSAPTDESRMPVNRWLTQTRQFVPGLGPAMADAAIGSPPVVTVVDPAALRRAQQLVGTAGPWSHLCLGFVRSVFGLPGRDPSAIQAWHNARFKHAGDQRPPAGVPVFWAGGGPGHVAVSTGDGWVVTSDLPSSGRISRVRLDSLHKTWHLRYLGWTDDLEGVRLGRR